MNGANKRSWYDAMKAESATLNKNETCSLVDLHNGARAIDSKWVFALKKDEKGNIERFKARLVVKGCSQRVRVNYEQTFSPVFDDTLSNGIRSSVEAAFTSDRYKLSLFKQ